MRNTLIAGTAALALALGASSAFAMPPNSPYAIWEPQAVDRGNGFAGDNAVAGYGLGGLVTSIVTLPGNIIEGRSAFVEPAPLTADPFGWQVTSPEDSTYYSRGR